MPATGRAHAQSEPSRRLEKTASEARLLIGWAGNLHLSPAATIKILTLVPHLDTTSPRRKWFQAAMQVGAMSFVGPFTDGHRTTISLR